ncbi:MAG: methionine--tRNA ligase, partial [Bacilli bacterium]
HRPVEKKEEETYFFKMSKYADRLVEYYNNHLDFIEPEASKNEMINNFIKPGLEDLSVSRTSFNWGIKVNEDPSHVIYVWIDALANYITALGYLSEDDSQFQKYWSQDSEILQLVGKEIARFHVIYWPIMLMALGLRIPDKVISHGWIIMKDGKMSKSKGNVIDPNTLIDRYGVDALRHYLLSQISLGSDGTYSPEQFINCLNTDLANNLGNLLNRVVAMIEKYFKGSVSASSENNPLHDELQAYATKTIDLYTKHMDAYHINKASTVVFEYISRLNKYIDETMPWALAKEEDKQGELANVLLNLGLGLRQVALLLKPFFIEIPTQIFRQLNIDRNGQTFATLQDFDYQKTLQVTSEAPIFNRLKLEDEIDYLSGTKYEKE